MMAVSVLVPIMLIGAIAVFAIDRSNSRRRGSRCGGTGGAGRWAGDSGSGSEGVVSMAGRAVPAAEAGTAERCVRKFRRAKTPRFLTSPAHARREV